MLPTLIDSCRSGGTVSYVLPLMTNATIWNSISQAVLSWVAIFHLRQPMVCLSHSSYSFILRAVRLSCKLLGQGYVRERLKSSLRKFYGRYGDLIKHYEVLLSQMLHDILGHDHIQLHPQLIGHFTKSRLCYRTGPYYCFDVIAFFR